MAVAPHELWLTRVRGDGTTQDHTAVGVSVGILIASKGVSNYFDMDEDAESALTFQMLLMLGVVVAQYTEVGRRSLPTSLLTSLQAVVLAYLVSYACLFNSDFFQALPSEPPRLQIFVPATTRKTTDQSAQAAVTSLFVVSAAAVMCERWFAAGDWFVDDSAEKKAKAERIAAEKAAAKQQQPRQKLRPNRQAPPPPQRRQREQEERQQQRHKRPRRKAPQTPPKAAVKIQNFVRQREIKAKCARIAQEAQTIQGREQYTQDVLDTSKPHDYKEITRHLWIHEEIDPISNPHETQIQELFKQLDPKKYFFVGVSGQEEKCGIRAANFANLWTDSPIKSHDGNNLSECDMISLMTDEAKKQFGFVAICRFEPNGTCQSDFYKPECQQQHSEVSSEYLVLDPSSKIDSEEEKNAFTAGWIVWMAGHYFVALRKDQKRVEIARHVVGLLQDYFRNPDNITKYSEQYNEMKTNLYGFVFSPDQDIFENSSVPGVTAGPLKFDFRQNPKDTFPSDYKGDLNNNYWVDRDWSSKERVLVFGDMHCCVINLLAVLTPKVLDELSKGTTALVFTGDIWDRGVYGLETAALILALQKSYRQNVVVIAGNHETEDVYQMYGLSGELMHDFNGDADNNTTKIAELVQWLPCAARVVLPGGKKGLFFHGGVPLLDTNEPFKLKSPRIKILPRFKDQFLWNDFGVETKINSDRGIGKMISRADYETFIEQNDIDITVSGHQHYYGMLSNKQVVAGTIQPPRRGDYRHLHFVTDKNEDDAMLVGRGDVDHLIVSMASTLIVRHKKKLGNSNSEEQQPYSFDAQNKDGNQNPVSGYAEFQKGPNGGPTVVIPHLLTHVDALTGIGV